MELNESRIQEFLDAAALRGPQVGEFVRDQALKRFGHSTPGIAINFVRTPKRNPDGTLLLEAENPSSFSLGQSDH